MHQKFIVGATALFLVGITVSAEALTIQGRPDSPSIHPGPKPRLSTASPAC
jgi:hypothetical protein